MFKKIVTIIVILTFSCAALANPQPQEPSVPPGSYTVVEDDRTLGLLGLDRSPVWCYDTVANAKLLAAPENEREKCELTVNQALSVQAAKYDLDIETLQLRISTLESEYQSMVSIKDKEIEGLTKVALKKPNNYWYVYLAVGVAVGIVGTIFISEAMER